MNDRRRQKLSAKDFELAWTLRVEKASPREKELARLVLVEGQAANRVCDKWEQTTDPHPLPYVSKNHLRKIVAETFNELFPHIDPPWLPVMQ